MNVLSVDLLTSASMFKNDALHQHDMRGFSYIDKDIAQFLRLKTAPVHPVLDLKRHSYFRFGRLGRAKNQRATIKIAALQSQSKRCGGVSLPQSDAAAV